MLFRSGVDRTGGLVEDQDRRVRQERAGDGEQLLLAGAQRGALVVEHGVVPVGERVHEAVDVRRPGGLEDLLLVLIAVTIVVSLQAVGIVLVVAMITTPAATAQLLVRRFDRMIVVAALVGVASGVIGLYASYLFDVASGASIVLVETLLFVVVLALTRLRGRGASA